MNMYEIISLGLQSDIAEQMSNNSRLISKLVNIENEKRKDEAYQNSLKDYIFNISQQVDEIEDAFDISNHRYFVAINFIKKELLESGIDYSDFRDLVDKEYFSNINKRINRIASKYVNGRDDINELENLVDDILLLKEIEDEEVTNDILIEYQENGKKWKKIVFSQETKNQLKTVAITSLAVYSPFGIGISFFSIMSKNLKPLPIILLLFIVLIYFLYWTIKPNSKYREAISKLDLYEKVIEIHELQGNKKSNKPVDPNTLVIKRQECIQRISKYYPEIGTEI